MGRTPILLAAVLLSAGCVGAAPDSKAAPPTQGPDALSDPLVFWSNPPFKATETTIAVNKNGDIFYGAADGGGDFAKAPIFRSRDNGTTWTEVTPRLPNGDRAPT